MLERLHFVLGVVLGKIPKTSTALVRWINMESRWKRKALSRWSSVLCVMRLPSSHKKSIRLCWWPPSFLPRFVQTSTIGLVRSTCFFSFRLPPLLLRLESGTSRAHMTERVCRSLWRPTWCTFLVTTAAVWLWHRQVTSNQFWAGLTAPLTPECLPSPSLATPGRSDCDALRSDRCPLCTTGHAVLLRQRTLRKGTDEAHICWLPVEG